MSKMKKIVGTTTIDKSLEKFLIENSPSVQKKLKALEIIINKNVNIKEFREIISLDKEDDYKLLHYNNRTEEEKLTETEYEAIKEWLEVK